MSSRMTLFGVLSSQQPWCQKALLWQMAEGWTVLVLCSNLFSFEVFLVFKIVVL